MKLSPLRLGLVVLLPLAAIAFAAAGLHRVPEGELWVRFDRAGQPAAEVGPGTHWWLPPGGKGIARFPAAPDTLLFPDPAQGGQAPYEVYRLALGSGLFEEHSAVDSLRVLRRSA